MRRIDFIKNLAAVVGAFFSGEALKGCSKGGIEAINGPGENKPRKEEAIYEGLPVKPYAIWDSEGNIPHFREGYAWKIDSDGKDLGALAGLPLDGEAHFLNRTLDNLVYQFIHNDGSSKIYENRNLGSHQPVDFGMEFENINQYETPAISPDGNWIALTINKQMYIGDFPPTRIPLRIPLEKYIPGITAVGQYAWQPEQSVFWKPNGKKIAFAAQTQNAINIYEMIITIPLNGDLYDVNTNNLDIQQRTFYNYLDFCPSLSPDGDIAFESTRFGGGKYHSICLLKMGEEEPEKIAQFSGTNPRFGLGNTLIYSEELVMGWRIMKITNVIQ